MKTTRLFASIMTTALLLQSFLPLVTAQDVRIPQSKDSSRTIEGISPRQARIGIAAEYNKLIDAQNLRASNILELGAKLYIYNTTLPLCQTYQSVVPRELAQQSRLSIGSLNYRQGDDSLLRVASPNQQLEKTQVLCQEVMNIYRGKVNINESISDDIEDLRRGFFESFVPTKDYDQFVQDMSALPDEQAREQYIADNISLEELNAIQQYISTGERTYQDRCELSQVDKTSYDQAVRAYSLATDTKNTQAQALALRTMQDIQKRAVCPNQNQAPVIVSSECAQQLNITQAQIEILSRDTAKNATQIAKLQQTREALVQEERCISTDIAGLPSLPINFQPGNQTMTTQVIGMQGQQTILPDKTSPICTTTARTLGEQLSTAPVGTLDLLISKLESYSFDENKKPLVSLVQTLATRNLNQKKAALGIGNDAQAFENLLRNIVHIANNVFENRAINNIIDIFPDISSYLSQIEQTSLGGIQSIDEFSDAVRDGKNLEWSPAMSGFNEGIVQQAGIRVAVPAKKENTVNNMVFKLNEVSALKYTNTIEMYPYSTQGSFPTLAELQGYLFGQPFPTNDYYNRVWMEILAADTDQLSNELYQVLQKNKSQYPLFDQANIGVEVRDIFGYFITTVTNYETRELLLMPAGIYRTQTSQFLEVGENGETQIYYQNETVLPQAISITQHINNNLMMGFNGSIAWPDLVFEYARLEENQKILDRDYVSEVVAVATGYVHSSGADYYYIDRNNFISSKSPTPTRQVVTTKRQSSLPLSVEGEFFADPHTFTLAATRTPNGNGTNTIDATFQIRGGTLCDPLVIELSTVYYADEYGIPPVENNDNPFISANLKITFNGYETTFSISDMQTFVTQIQDAMNNGGDIVSIINDAVGNNLKLFDTPFGTLEANEGGVVIRYADTEYGVADVMPLIMDVVLDKINYGWLERIMGVLDFGDDSQEEPQEQGIFGRGYSRGESIEKEEEIVFTFNEKFRDGSQQLVSVDNPILYISRQGESSIGYPLSLRADGQYSAMVPAGVRSAIETATHDVRVELFFQEQKNLSIQSQIVQQKPIFSIANQKWNGDYTFTISYADQNGSPMQLDESPVFYTESYDQSTDSWSYTQVSMDRNEQEQSYIYDIIDVEKQNIIDQAVQIYVTAIYQGEEATGYYKMQIQR